MCYGIMTLKVKQFKVWDRTTRVFHWVNAASVIALMIIGILILNSKLLGIEGEAKVLLKTIHAFVGYVFVLNLFWRLVWAFFGNYYSRWRQFLPIEEYYLKNLKHYIVNLFSGVRQQYIGHNPIARLVVSFFFLLLSIQAITGLIIAGTDLYYPPFGEYFAEWVTEGDKDRLKNLTAGNKTHVVEEAYQEMRSFRKPIITIHVYSFYILLILVPIHIFGVIFTELREQGGLVSSMITGNKILEDEPVDKNKL